MPRPIEDDGAYYERRSDPNRADREISLGTSTILAIFFALALVCACFFGFGYTMGHNSARTAEAAASVVTPIPAAASGPKPAAGSVATQPAAPAAPSIGDSAASSSAPAQTAIVSLAPSTAAKDTVAPSDRIIAGDKLPAAATPQPATANLQPATSFVVQIAAVSTQDIADIEVGALKKDGYAVVVRHEPQDKLLHVQIGPFTDRKTAEAMQKRVLADGFNAIVK